MINFKIDVKIGLKTPAIIVVMVVYMSAPGLEAGTHVFFALLSVLTATAMLALVYKRIGDKSTIKTLGIATAIFVWLSWLTVAPVYVNEYGADKAMIKSYENLKPAHAFGMETKEHIFYTGLILATTLLILSYSVDPTTEAGRRLLMWSLAILILGFIVLDVLGAWIGISAKNAWMLKTGS